VGQWITDGLVFLAAYAAVNSARCKRFALFSFLAAYAAVNPERTCSSPRQPFLAAYAAVNIFKV
tara:strand:- start:1007 stop:1198 length:192 start_codon:yes stop_codon:yes gene_type:complete